MNRSFLLGVVLVGIGVFAFLEVCDDRSELASTIPEQQAPGNRPIGLEADVIQGSPEKIEALVRVEVDKPPSRNPTLLEEGVPKSALVRVTSEAGDPLSRVELVLVASGEAGIHEVTESSPWSEETGVARDRHSTDPNGECVLHIISEGANLLIAKLDGYSSERHWLDRQDREVDITLRQAQPMTGTVYHGDLNVPVPGAQVVAVPWPESGERELGDQILEQWLLSENARTNERGDFVLRSLATGFTEIQVFAEGYPRYTTRLYPSGQHLEVKLDARAAVHGIVRDDEGQLVEGAVVGIGSRGRIPVVDSAIVETDFEGRFVIEDAPLGPVFAWAQGPGLDTQVLAFEVDPSSSEPLEFELNPEATLDGSVVDQAGRPVVGAQVTVIDRTNHARVGQMSTLDDGSWFMSWVCAGHSLSIEAYKDGFAMTALTDVIAPYADLTIVLRERSSIQGMVVDESGEPVPQFSIHYTPLEFSEPWEEIARSNEKWHDFSTSDGRFQIHEAWPGPLELQVEAPGFEPRTVELVTEPGETSEPVEIPLKRGVSIRGRVLAPGGSPVAGAEVLLPGRLFSGLASELVTRHRTFTGPDGSFQVRGLPEDGFDLLIRTNDLGMRLLTDLDPAVFPRDIVFEQPGSLMGRATVPWQMPQSVCEFVLRLPGSKIRSDAAVPDVQGSFRFEAVAPGTYFLEFWDHWGNGEHSGEGYQGQMVVVESNKTTDVEFSTKGHCVISGAVGERASRDRWFDYQASLWSQAGEPAKRMAECPLDDAGKFAFYGLEPGSYRVDLVSTHRGNALRLSHPVTVTAAEPLQELSFTVPAPSLQGFVWNEIDEPTDAVVSLIDLRGGELLTSTRTNSEGRFLARDVSTQRCLLWINARGYAEDYFETVTLSAEAEAEPLEYWLEREARLEILVEDDRGIAVGRAQVEVNVDRRPDILPALEKLSDPLGRASFARLGAGRALLSCAKEGFVPVSNQTVTLRAGTRAERVLSLSRLGSLLVIVVDEEGNHLAKQRLTVEPMKTIAEESTKSGLTTPDGEFLFENLVPGTFQVTLEGGFVFEVVVAPGEQSMLRAAVSPVATN